MKTEKIICSMNGIKDEYVIEYAERTKIVKAKAYGHFRAWGVAAACLAILIICAPVLTHIFNHSGYDDPGSGARYEFGSYSELCSVLPEESIIKNVPNSKEADISAYAECPEGTTDFTDYNNYSYLNVDISYDDGAGVNIFCVVKSEKTAKEDVDSKPILFPPEKVSLVTVSDCDIYYTGYEDVSQENGIAEVNIAEFSIDGSLYKFSTTSFSREELIQYIKDMLN